MYIKEEVIMEKKTPLYDAHVAAEGRIIPFAGFLLPVQYQAGVINEHLAVRNNVGMFDVSHMGEAVLKGKDALKNLNYIMTNDFTNLKIGSCRYTLMLYPDGGQVDDLIVYRTDEDEYLLVLNASNTEKDVEWIAQHLSGECELLDTSIQIAQIAVQGPNSKEIMASLCEEDELPQKFYTFTKAMQVAGVECLVSRTGYTGEFGYEIYVNQEESRVLWDALLEKGVIPCGLGARDTLRLEAAMPLYGHELSKDIHVASTNLGFAIKTAKDDFIGKDACVNPKEGIPTRVGLKVTGRGIVRGEEPVLYEGKEVGYTTSGTHCPFLGAAYAMAYVDKSLAEEGTVLTVVVRGREVETVVTPLPFYKK